MSDVPEEVERARKQLVSELRRLPNMEIEIPEVHKDGSVTITRHKNPHQCWKIIERDIGVEGRGIRVLEGWFLR